LCRSRHGRLRLEEKRSFDRQASLNSFELDLTLLGPKRRVYRAQRGPSPHTGVDVDPLTIRVDLRSAWSSVRDQGGRSACLACAASDAHAYCRGRAQPLSAEFLFYHAGQRMPHKSVALGLTYDAVDLALQADGQPDEAEWPYTTTEPNPWTPPAVSQRWHGDLKPRRRHPFACERD